MQNLHEKDKIIDILANILIKKETKENRDFLVRILGEFVIELNELLKKNN